MLANIGGWHLILLLAVLLLLFGAARLPALAKGVGQSVRILKRETKEAEPTSAGKPTADDPGGR
ncbi:sec-independent protein translocase protein TatA [Microbacterium sp. BE35]|uniref:twin-arginine translocase TatA/TatE family subunit n=1 Tax=Microbacterium sp. BE35 TaxID=2817773 RepID=UPI0028618173|nr:twin-arginine translocase TatA/TatE family subunit [Microbacterium sp. BE35]MDR7187402.1 sec-independent protein translocase protein TatA [Microbacterium sp. BE35]